MLGALLGDNVDWTATIGAECERKQRQLELPGLVDAAGELLGEPLFPLDGEHAAIR